MEAACVFGYHPIITAVHRGRITGAKCSACDAALQLGDEFTTVDDHERRLAQSIEDHVREHHPRKRFTNPFLKGTSSKIAAD